jgi:UDP-N-acetylglucosamine 2-epimerase
MCFLYLSKSIKQTLNKRNKNLEVLNLNERIEAVTIAGNRPEIIKLSEFIKSNDANYKNFLLYSGQHYSPNMRDVFFDDLNVKLDYDLGCDTSNVALLRESIRTFLKKIQPPYVVVYGDTATTLAGALAAKDLSLKLIHLEAGLRCFNTAFVEERNRIQVDALSDYLFAPTKLHELFLTFENLPGKVFTTGNLIVDVCKKFSTLSDNPRNDIPSEYVLLTLHKPDSVEDPEALKKISKLLSKIKYKVVFPVHPRTKNSLSRHHINLPFNVTVIEATGYKDFIVLLKNCLIVMTDSGGVQEEAIILKKPCITLFSTSDRQETILLKANRLFFPLDGGQSISDVIEEMRHTKITINPYGENVTHKVVEIVNDIIHS